MRDIKHILKGDIELSDIQEMFDIFTDPLQDTKVLKSKESKSKLKGKKERINAWKSRYKSLSHRS